MPVGGEIGQAGDTRQGAGTNSARFREYVMKTNAERDHAINQLREQLHRGTVIYTVLRHKNRMGTCRWIEFYFITDNRPENITWHVAQAIDSTYCRRRDALRITGCGLDVGFAAVYNLSSLLFGDGYALKQRWL